MRRGTVKGWKCNNTGTGNRYYKNGEECSQCSRPTNASWSADTGCDWKCKSGSGNTRYYQSGNSCPSCTKPDNSTWGSGCNWKCNAGSYKNGNSCTACPVGTYSSAGATSCSTCADDEVLGYYIKEKIGCKHHFIICWQAEYDWVYHSGSYSGCGEIKLHKRKYCQTTGNTSSTANYKDITEDKTVKGCGVDSECYSGKCRACGSGGHKEADTTYLGSCEYPSSGGGGAPPAEASTTTPSITRDEAIRLGYIPG